MTTLEIPSLAPDENKFSPVGSLGIINIVMEEMLRFAKNKAESAEVLTKADGSGKKYKKCHGK